MGLRPKARTTSLLSLRRCDHASAAGEPGKVLPVTSRINAAMGLVAVILMVYPFRAEAQCTATGSPAECSQSGSVATTTDYVVKLGMSSTTTAIAAPTPADFVAGFSSSTGLAVTVSANSSWTLSARAGSSTWGHTNTSGSVAARADKPAADLRWSIAANGTFQGLSGSDVSIATGSAAAAALTTLYYRTIHAWALDTPGAYSLSVVLTLAAP
jgi:hypothetical protein